MHCAAAVSARVYYVACRVTLKDRRRPRRTLDRFHDTMQVSYGYVSSAKHAESLYLVVCMSEDASLLPRRIDCVPLE